MDFTSLCSSFALCAGTCRALTRERPSSKAIFLFLFPARPVTRRDADMRCAPSDSPLASIPIFTLALPGKSKKVSRNLKKVLKRGFVGVGRPHLSSLGSASLTDRRGGTKDDSQALSPSACFLTGWFQKAQAQSPDPAQSVAGRSS